MRILAMLSLVTVVGAWIVPASRVEAGLSWGVPVDIFSYANDDGSNVAESRAAVESAFTVANWKYFHPQGIHISVRYYHILNSTEHNTLTSDPDPYQSVTNAKLNVDGSGLRSNYILAAFFTQASTPGGGWGIAWGGGPAPLGISYEDILSPYLIAHEIGHNLGLLHLEDYAPGSGMNINDEDEFGNLLNPSNVMSGGVRFEEWQADIMRMWAYGYAIPEPSTFFLTGLGTVWLVRRSRRRGAKAPRPDE